MKPFSAFMQEWLYGENGYYAKYRDIGKGGDFYTAVSSSQFFGGAISNRLISVIDEGFLDHRCAVVEIGAHLGYLMADIVQFLYTLRPELLQTLEFIVVEPHEENIKAQNAYFQDSFGDAVKLSHVSDLSELSKKSAFVISNEIFDAFACDIVKEGKMVVMNDFNPEFVPQTHSLLSHCEKYGIVSGEVGVGYEAFARAVHDAFEKCEFVSFDYGDLEPRPDFSIRIYHKHHTYPFFALTDFVTEVAEKPRDVNLEMLYQKSDITYDVHFGHLIDAFDQEGLKLVYFKTQMAMLIEFGLIALLEKLMQNADEKTYQSELGRARVLIDPAFMGERFKGVVFRKGEK